MSEPADVIQGRLGWEAGDISEADPNELEPHERNREIYGDTDSVDELEDTFLESVEEKGVLEPLVITEGKKIISGHRRWLAAREAGLGSVPIRYAEFESELAEREALIEFNRQREKTPGQVVNEFEEMLDIEKERAKERNSKTAGEDPSKEILPDTEKGQARDKAAEKVNSDVSGRTLEKGLRVKEKAEEGDETAKEQWDKLQEGDTSFHRAHKEVEKAEAEEQVNEQRDTDTEQPTIKHTTANELLNGITPNSVDLLLTDPPYSTDLEDTTQFAKQWLPDALNTLSPSGFAFVFVGAYPKELQTYLNVIHHATSHEVAQVLVWTYKNTLGQSPNDEYKLNWQAILFIRGTDAPELNAPKTAERWAVHEVNAPDGRTGERYHKWEKPRELIERLVRHTTTEGDTVLDLFAGTGTIPLVSAELGRGVLACDSDREMLGLAEQRGCVINDS